MSYIYDVAFILVALFALGFTIFIHELGHFLAARRRGLVIRRFSIGFGPRIFGWTRNGIEYRLSAIPFGGYVALPQLVDMGRIEGGEANEANDTEHKQDDGEEQEANSKSSESLPKISYADKMIVSVMGAVFNVLLAFVLACILGLFGYDRYDSELTTRIGYVADTVERWDPLFEENEQITSPAKAAGILPGDQVLAVDGNEVVNFMDIQNRIVTGTGRTDTGKRLVSLTILRENQRMETEVHPAVFGNEEIRIIGIGPAGAFFIDDLNQSMPAAQAGLEKGDQPISINGSQIHSFRQLQKMIQNSEPGTPISLTVSKGGEDGPLETYSITPVEKDLPLGEGTTRRKLIGFSPEFKVITTYPNPFVLIVRRVKDMYLTLSGLVSPKSDVKLRNMSGPVGIVNHLSIFAKIGFKKLLWFVVFINVNLAILNLLPIPVLDGGHMLFATVEKLRGKPLPLAFLERAQVLFVILLFSFMLYVTFFDVRRIFP